MTSFDGKQLKKVVKQLRAAGVKSYKCDEFEIVLADETPTISRRKKRSASPDTSPDKIISENSLSEEDLMFWSVTGDPSTITEEVA